jgi:bacillaene synthase trans-acting acyltransferase
VSHKTVFMFSGQGSHYHQMGRELFETNTVFRESMSRLDGLARSLLRESVVEAIYSGRKDAVFDRTRMTHPAIFMIEYALAQCLIRGGLTPDLTLGASLGSFAAAAIAGFVDEEEALTAIIRQAAAFEACCERGSMIAVLGDPRLFEQRFLRDRSELAGVNFANHFAVSAVGADLAQIEAELRERNVTHQRLAVSFAFHSRWIDDARPQFEAFLESAPGAGSCAAGRLPLACCEQATVLTSLPKDFFWRVVRGSIRFRDTVAALERSGPFRYIDVGPSGTLANFVKYGLPAGSRSSAFPTLTPFGQDRRNIAALLQ